ncbi:hypothetical protein AGMMS49992_29800 [Clostridia bacterium]|nr:hypothetical protein AGMMS49992_29800 [Clostridia bacterium]
MKYRHYSNILRMANDMNGIQVLTRYPANPEAIERAVKAVMDALDINCQGLPRCWLLPISSEAAFELAKSVPDISLMDMAHAVTDTPA